MLVKLENGKLLVDVYKLVSDLTPYEKRELADMLADMLACDKEGDHD